MQENARMEPGKGFLGVRAGGWPRNPDLDMDGTENPSLIIRGGILAGHSGRKFFEQVGGIG